MEKYLNIMKNCKLFNGMTDDDILKSIDYLKGTIKKYNKDDIIYSAGDEISKLGIVLSGSILITKNDIMGNRNILTSIPPSGLFAETFVCSNIKYISNNVISNSKSKILFLEFKQLTEVSKSNYNFHNNLILNMLIIISNKNFVLNNKLEILSAKNTRDKLMSYFSIQININNNNKFNIPFNRESLADYLNLNRSSMSRELSRMRDEGIIRFNKNEFEILLYN